MKIQLFLPYLLAFLFAIPCFLPAQSKRLALLIGNQDYLDKSMHLASSIQDIDSLQTALEGCDFEVIRIVNGDKKNITDAVVSFAQKLETRDAGLLFFAGDGVGFEQINYLLPINSSPKLSEQDLKQKCVSTMWIETEINERKAPGIPVIMLFDGCGKAKVKSGKKSYTHWVEPKQTRQDFYTWYAVSQQTLTTLTTHDRNSLFITAFLKQFNALDKPLQDLLNEVRKELVKNKYPDPIISGIPALNFYLKKTAPNPAPMADADSDGVPDSVDKCPHEKGCQAANGCIFYFEDFSTNKDGWYVGDSPRSPSSIQDGKYFIELTSSKDWWARWNPGRLIEADTEKDFEIESAIRCHFLQPESEFGLRWAITPIDTLPNGTIYSNSCLLFLNQAKQVYVQKYLFKEDKYVDILSTTDFYSDDIFDFQKIRIVKRGKEMNLFINDKLVKTFPSDEPALRDLGFVMRRKVKIEVDYLKLNYLDPSP